MLGQSRAYRLVLMLALCLALVGCSGGAATGITGEFARVELAEAPAEVQASYERMKALPGLFVLHSNGETYLLLLAGRGDQPGLVVDVLSLQATGSGGKEIRLLAVVTKGQGGGMEYPHAVIRLKAPPTIHYKARLSTSDEQVIELREMPMANKF